MLIREDLDSFQIFDFIAACFVRDRHDEASVGAEVGPEQLVYALDRCNFPNRVRVKIKDHAI